MESYSYLDRGSRPGPIDNLNEKIKRDGYLVEGSWDGFGEGGIWRMKVRPEDAVRDLALMCRELLDAIRMNQYGQAELPDVGDVVDRHALATHFVHMVRPRTAWDKFQERKSGYDPLRSSIIERYPRGAARECGVGYDRSWRQQHGDVR